MPLASVSRKIALLFWILAIAAIPIWSRTDPPGYDVVFYHNAIRALHIGDDPYLDATAIQDAFHREYGLHSNGYPPCSYVYSPITLPLLRLIGDLPVWLAGTLYWLLLIASALSLLWVGTLAGLPWERIFLRLFLPLALFVPGLLAHDTILSGNVAFILYGLVLVTAAYGWKRNRWLWCYLAIIVASCFKAPLLCLVAIPLFSARRQWIAAAITTGTGVLLFAIQPLLWPALFRHFLRAVQLQFTYNHDFGSSPAGVFSNILVHKGLPYSVPGMVFYVIYAVLIFATLLYLSRLFLDGLISLQQWLPVLLVGAILLNPRIMEYDLAPLAVPMALIGWRVFGRMSSRPRGALLYLVLFLTANVLAVHFEPAWKPIECILLIATFTSGCWDLVLRAAANRQHQTSAAVASNAPSLVPSHS